MWSPFAFSLALPVLQVTYASQIFLPDSAYNFPDVRIISRVHGVAAGVERGYSKLKTTRENGQAMSLH